MFIPKLETLSYINVPILQRKNINNYVRSDIINVCLKNINQISKLYKFKCIYYKQNKDIKLDLIQL